METLPIFPLNTVLFPGMPLQLHIFEERYKLMIADCHHDQQSFGVVLIKSGQEAFGPLAEPYLFGCEAKIIEIEKLDDGRMNISTVGLERFKIINYFEDKPYLQAETEPFPIQISDSGQINKNQQRIKYYLTQYLRLLAKAENMELSDQQLPEIPEKLAYLSAYVLQTGADEKQRLLEQSTLQDFQSLLLTMFRKEIPLLRAFLSTLNTETVFPFSNN